jgi:hypothetical protein
VKAIAALVIAFVCLMACITHWQNGGRSMPSGLVAEIPGTRYAVVALYYPHWRGYVQLAVFRGPSTVMAGVEFGPGRMKAWGRWLRYASVT